MIAPGTADNPVVSLAYLPATQKQRLIVLIVVIAQVAAFGIIAPFASTQLARLDAFVPTIESVIAVNDLITSILLFAQFSIFPSRALLALAGGYLFTALIVTTHVLTFPGAFSPIWIRGVGLQSAPWLAFAWHIGSTISVLIYTCLKGPSSNRRISSATTTISIGWCVTIVVCVVIGLTWTVTSGEKYMPPIFVNSVEGASAAFRIIGFLNISLAAATLATLWIRRRCILDYWLIITIVAVVAEQALTLLLNAARYSLGFYAGRAFLLFASAVVLALLLQEISRLYAQLARANAALERERDNKLMNVGATAAAIAHELKQPLAAMVANADASLEFLEQMPPDLSQAKEALNDIVTDGHHTGEALDGIRTLFRNVNQRREPVDVNEISREVMHSLRTELNGSGITARSELSAEIPLVQVNRGQIQQVIFNLAHNAVEAMSGTTGRSRVLRLTTQRVDHNRIVIAVQDTGPGIDPKRLDEIFDAFVTSKPQGIGLGLAICRVIVERHGGELTAFSDGKSGALFQFSLPIATKEAGTE